MLAQREYSVRHMKKDWVLSSGFLILLLILIVGVVFLPVGADTIIGSAKFDPDVGWNLSSGPPASSVDAIIRFKTGSGYDPHDINSSTVLLEGSVPTLTTANISGGFVATFWGIGVYNVMSAKVGHMGVIEPPWKVWLTVTGNLKDSAGGTAFSAEGYLRVNFPKYPPPP